ncbi:MAG: transcription-repair coupling factor, partial [Pseudomonadota bacterium]
MKNAMPLPDLSKKHSEICGVPHGAESFILSQIATNSSQDFIYIACGEREAESVRTGLEFFAGGKEIIVFPAWDCLPYDRASPNAAVLAARIVALSQIAAKSSKPRIIITTINAALQKLPPKSLIDRATFPLQAGKPLSHDKLVHFLSENGYRRTAKAMEAGEFAVRGSIIDIIPSDRNEGIRLDTFGDHLETIRSFDPISQISSENIANITLCPASEVILNGTTIATFREKYRSLFGAVTKEDQTYESISEGRGNPGMENLLPLFYDSLATIFDYLPSAGVIIDSQADMARKERLELIEEYYQARKNSTFSKKYSSLPYPTLSPQMLYLDEQNWVDILINRNTITLKNFLSPDPSKNLDYRPARNFALDKLSGEELFDNFRSHTAACRERKRSML